MKRVLIFTYYWPPSGGAGVQRWLKFSKFLPEFDWEPVIITVDPEYATYPVLDDSLSKEIGDNIRVIRTKSSEWFSFYKKASGSEQVPYAGFASENKNVGLKQKLARFARGNFFLPDPRKGWNKYALVAARDYLSKEKADCIVTTGTPHSSHLIGKELSQQYNIPWVADFRDPWTDIYYYREFYPTILAHRINQGMENSVLRQADRVLTVSPFLKKLFESKIKTGKEKVHVISNGYDPDNFKLKIKKEDRFVITYIGTMTGIYNLEAFLSAYKKLFKETKDILLRFIGTISKDQEEKVKALPEGSYEIISYLNHQSVLEYLYRSSVLLLIIPDHASSGGIVPGKMFEYMAVGRPILCLGREDSDAASVIRDKQSGKVNNSQDEASIYETLSGWKKNYPSVLPNEKYSRKNLTAELAKVLNSLHT